MRRMDDDVRTSSNSICRWCLKQTASKGLTAERVHLHNLSRRCGKRYAQNLDPIALAQLRTGVVLNSYDSY